MPVDFDTLLANAEVTERLSWTFDYRIEAEPRAPYWFTVDGVSEFQHLGRDSTGGEFVRLPDKRILYASSEGEVGIIAADFNAFIELIVTHPYWQGILKFSGGGKLAEMRRAAIALEARALVQEGDLEEARAFVKSQLGLEQPTDAVGALHRAISTSGVVARAYGAPCVSLFNRFTIDDTPMLRGLVD
jgi:hypothetical protein